MITVIGLHGGESFGRRAEAALAAAEIVVAAPRHRERLVLAEGQLHVELSGPLHAVLDQVEAAEADGRVIAMVASGDPRFVGIV
ncbi:MAG: hypothetical protein ACR2LA_02325 [Acidimicrobiales bacterium]